MLYSDLLCGLHFGGLGFPAQFNPSHGRLRVALRADFLNQHIHRAANPCGVHACAGLSLQIQQHIVAKLFHLIGNVIFESVNGYGARAR